MALPADVKPNRQQGKTTVSVAVLIVNFNSGPLLGECLRHVCAQTRRPERVIVVDNASNDGSADWAECDYPGVAVVRLESNQGFAAANNLAARQAGEVDWLALLNPDAFPKPDWLERLLAATDRHPECASFGSRLLDANDPGRLDGTGDVYHVSGLAWRRDHGWPVISGADEAGEIFAPCAAAALYRRDAFLEAGGFDEDSRMSIWDSGCGCSVIGVATFRTPWSDTSGRRSPDDAARSRFITAIAIWFGLGARTCRPYCSGCTYLSTCC